MTIRWTEAAASDLESIYDFLARGNDAAALDVVLGIHSSVEQLTKFPNLGRTADAQFPTGTRILMRPPYLIFYHLLEDIIVADSILHGSRRHE